MDSASQACDCHAHIFGPFEKFPLAASANYLPAEATLENYKAMLERLNISRCVLVQPSVYDTDNACLIDALNSLGSAARGVAVINPDVSEENLKSLNSAGVRGVRINTMASNRSLNDIEELAERVQPYGWHLQILLSPENLVAEIGRLKNLSCGIVLDHFAMLDPHAPMPNQPLDRLIELLHTNKVWVKLSSPYLLGATKKSEFLLYRGIVNRLLAERPDRLLWATDWPHPAFKGNELDDAELLNVLHYWVPEDLYRRKILQDNPKELYGF